MNNLDNNYYQKYLNMQVIQMEMLVLHKYLLILNKPKEMK